MNAFTGHPSTSNLFGMEHSAFANNSNLSFLSNPMGLSFFGNSNNSANIKNSIFKTDTISDSAASANSTRFSSASNVRSVDLDKLWGIGEDNPIIDDNAVKEQSYLESKTEATDETGDRMEDLETGTGNEAEGGAIDTDITIEEGIAEGAEVASAGTPWGLAALINQQVGASFNNAITTGQENQSSQDFQQNMNQHGVNVSLNANLLQQQQQQTIKADSAGGAIGSIFGPLGVLIGHAVAGTVQANPNLFNTAGSSQGWVNPTDTTASNSASTASLSGQSTMVDNVD